MKEDEINIVKAILENMTILDIMKIVNMCHVELIKRHEENIKEKENIKEST